MTALEVRSDGVASVQTFAVFLLQLLDHAETVKPTRALEPALTKANFDDLYTRVGSIFAGFDDGSGKKLRQLAIVETAVRDVFIKLVSTCSIDTPDFVRVWNLFDILALLADNQECDPALLFWLIEELLDSQTIPGCRKVFDYLESRRERSVARHFRSSKLIILRTCNDLLRRLSRAEDTPFCGRVFIFLFQLFPLGDKSSVNLRGEFHVENVTTYDEAPAVPVLEDGTGAGAVEGAGAEKMDVDGGAAPPADDTAKPKEHEASGAAADKNKDKKSDVDFDALYPVFWSLQTSFSQPKKLFEATHFSQFRAGMEASMAAFRQISNSSGSRNVRHFDEARRGVKRKRDNGEANDLSETYNPKYLTSRDLFELETRDLTFRRHFLLQALIMMEFLLSLSPKAKERQAQAPTPNKSVLYADQVLSEDDTAWVMKMKQGITDHIRYSNPDGPYFLRMVDTILARDKNWVRWKAESCPPIARPAVSAGEFVAAKDSAQRAFARHRRRNNQMTPFSLDFLEDEEEDEEVVEAGKPRPPPIPPNRYTLPPLEAWKKEISNEDFEIGMPDSEASKKQAEERKASKTWRALRMVRQTNLALFDRIEDDNDINVVFAAGDTAMGEDATDAAGEAGADANGADNADDEEPPLDRDNLPADTSAVVLVGADDMTSTLVRLLRRRNPGVFGLVAQHTTKPAAEKEAGEGEDNSKAKTGTIPFHHVGSRDFDVLLDGDKFVAFGELDGHRYGTLKSHIDTIAATGKMPVVLMNNNCVESARDNGFTARYVLVEPPSKDAAEADQSSFDKTIRLSSSEAAEADGGAEAAAKALEAYIYDTENEADKDGDTVVVQTGGDDSSSKGEAAPSADVPGKPDGPAQADTPMADAVAA